MPTIEDITPDEEPTRPAPAATLLPIFDSLPPLADPILGVSRKLADRRDQGTSLVDHSLLAVLSSDHLAGVAKAAHAIDDRAGYAIGALIGLAVGDCMGASLEFLPATEEPGESRWDAEAFCVLEPKLDEAERGVLAPGQWTDDTAMALCLADSLIVRGRLDGSDLRTRFWAWHAEGYNNCFRFDRERARRTSFGLGYNIAKSLLALEPGAPPPAAYVAPGSNDSGNGALMRLAPVAIWYASHAADDAAEAAERSAAATHPGGLAALSAAFLARLLHAALNLPAAQRARGARAFVLGAADAHAAELARRAPGLAPAARDDVLLLAALLRGAPPSPTEAAWAWRDAATPPPIAATLAARGASYNGHPVSRAYFGSYCMDALALALHAAAATATFEACVGRAVNFLGDADTVGAIAGQIGGAFYGEAAIDARHVAALRKHDRGETRCRASLCFLLGRQAALKAGRRVPRRAGGAARAGRLAVWLARLPPERRERLGRGLGVALALGVLAAAVAWEAWGGAESGAAPARTHKRTATQTVGFG